jgi:RNA-directed DNA polymerase
LNKIKPFTISKELVMQAFKLVKVNAGTAGVDHQSIADFERELKDNLYKIWNRMSSGTYFPPPVKAVPIPKKSRLDLISTTHFSCFCFSTFRRKK